MAIITIESVNTALKFTEDDGDFFYIEASSIHSTNPANGNVTISYDASVVELVQSEVITPASTDDQDLATKIQTLIDSSKAVGGGYENQIIVTQSNVATTLGGVIDSTKEYFLDGLIDITGISIEIPIGGINIKGFDFSVSGLVCADNNYTMFTSPVGGSGTFVFIDFLIICDGTSSKVFDITAQGSFDALEITRCNFGSPELARGCTSLGEINGYRQGFETGTGRFYGAPELTLSGTWGGGYFIASSIIRFISNMTALFRAGTAFTMASRFRSDMNLDLPAIGAFFDFSPSNFVNPSTLQIDGAIVTRQGVQDATDTTIYPNIDNNDLASRWTDNIGLPNTFEGGIIKVSSENLTSILAGSTWYTLNGIWAASSLTHFQQNTVVANAGALEHLGTSPREYQVIIDFSIEGQANNDIGIRIKKWDNSASTFIDFAEERRQINSFVGGRDVAFFNFIVNTALDQGDYLYFEVRNNSGNQDVTLELDSSFRVQTR